MTGIISAIIAGAVTLIGVLSACGKPMLPIESATVEQLVTTGLTVTAALVNWWKNNSFTPEAIKADGYLEQLREKK